jgi:hypothetical protein
MTISMADSASTSAFLPDAEAIRGLVVEVLKRLQSEVPRKVVPSSPLVPVTLPAPASGVPLAGRVISLSMLEKLSVGTSRVTIETAAVVTPSAREYARDKGIAIERARAGSSAVGAPFFVARAECASDMTSHAAAVARAVPGGVQLPATGLADVVAAFALHASRDGARGVLLTSRPAMATVLANRSVSLRAVTARDPAALVAAASETAANMLIIDPLTFPAAMLLRVATDLASRVALEIPAALAARPAGCGCKAH